MTVGELMQKSGSSIYIVDGKNRYWMTPWDILFEVFKDCVIDNIEATDINELEITLKTQLVKKRRLTATKT
ncbi:MAG: hypothetical protein UH239_05930 [Acutalibacteraceae bacterium]|nr:hypothetical protein [Acutalibacteraceae bacterium]